MTRKLIARAAGALLLAVLFGTGVARASSPITVNKVFAPNTVGLGVASTVVVTLQNSDTSRPANITAFKDNLDSMSGYGLVDTSFTPTTTCAGGTPAITGSDNNTISMNNGQVPMAPNNTTPGSCTITFHVFGNKIGAGLNSILAADVTTSLGSPGSDIVQQLLVSGANVTVGGTGPVNTLVGGTGTLTFTVTNPAAGVALTNTAFSINGNSAQPFSVSSATSNCGATVTPPAANVTAGSITVSGAIIPPGGTCTITVQTTSAVPSTVNFTLPQNSVTNAQGATNSGARSTQDVFTLAKPNISKTFNPTAILPTTGTTQLTINIQNILSAQPLTNAGITDALPGGLLLDAAAATFTNCGAPVVAGAGTATIAVTGATIPANTTCQIRVTVDAGTATGNKVNIIPAANFTSTEVTGAAGQAQASLLITGPGGGVSTGKAIAPNTVGPFTPTQVTLTFGSLAGGAMSAGTFTDNLPQLPQPMVVVNDATHLPTTTNCGGAPVITATSGATSVTGSGLAIATGGTCTVRFFIQFNAPTPGTNQTDTNTLAAANVSFTDRLANVVHPPGNATANVTELPSVSLRNYIASGQNLTNQTITVTASIDDTTGTADSGLVATFPLTPGKVQLAASPNFVFGPTCPASLSAGSITIGGSRESFSVNVGAINATCTIQYDVIDEAGAAGTFVPGNPSYTSAQTGAGTASFTGQNNVTFATSNINVTKVFVPNQIQAGSVSTVQVTTSVAGLTAPFTRTQANGVTFADNLPANVFFAPNPNVTYGPQCQVAGQPAPSSAIAGTSITFSNVSLLTVGVATQPCTVTFDVTSSVLGAPQNTIPANTINSTSGIKNALSATATLTVAAGVAIQKSYLSSTLQIGGTDYIRFLLTNSASASQLNNGSLIDNMPPTLALASTTLGPVPGQAGDPASCGGSIAAGAVGSSTFTLGNLMLGPTTGGGSIPGQCVVYVLVKASATAAPGPTSNTIGVGALNIGGYANQTPSSGTNTLTPAMNVVVTKAFSPATIAAGGTSTLTITVSNTAAGSAALSNVALTDTLPPQLQVAPVPNGSTTCGAGAVTATAGGSTVALTGGVLAPNATCTFSVAVTSATGGIWTNTIPTGALTTLQGASNAVPASGVLNVGNVSAVTLAKAFVPAAIPVNGTSTLTISVANMAAGAVPLSSIALTDSLPANVTVAPVPNAATSCPSGTATAVAGGTTVSLSGASLAANATCTISVSVTSAVTGIYVNLIPSQALTDAQGSTNTASAQATLNVGNSSGVGIAKTFAPAAIVANGTSVLTITLVNSSAAAVPLTAMGLIDNLPARVVVAAAPNATTSCLPGGTVTATPGTTSVTLSGGALAANATCTIAVTVTSATPGIYTNTIPPNALTDAQGSTNASPATALLNVGNASAVAVAKSFLPTLIAPGATSVLTISLANTSAGAVALSALSITDTLPANVTIAAAPNASTTCPGGTVTATGGAGNVALSGASLAPNGTCTIVLTVTGTTPGAYVNVISDNAIDTPQGATNNAPATATLTIGQPSLSVTKTSNPSGAPVSPGETITYTVAVRNGGTQVETNAKITDTLTNATLVPGSVTLNGVAAADGIVNAGRPIGSLAVGATATIVYRAVVNANAVTSAQVTNSATAGGDQPCSGPTCIAASPANTVQPPVLSAAKLIDGQSSESVLPGQTVTYSITVANTGAGPSINTIVTDVVPAGLAVVNGSIALNGASVTGATLSGQTVTVPAATILGGASAIVTFKAVVGTTMGTASNTVSVMAAGLSRAVTSNAATAREVPPTIAVTKTTTATTVTAGDRVDYSIVVTPLSGIAYGAATIVDTLPGYEIYAPGTARVAGKPLEPAVQGRTLIWTLPSLAGAMTFTYATAIGPGVPQNTTLTNTVNVAAVAPGGAGFGRGSSSASVLVVGSTFGSCYPITGRVYLDTYGSGRFRDPDVGLASVHIYLDNGESVTTDSTGRYDFPCVHPGMHALRLDATTLPPGVQLYDDRNIDSEKSTRRLVHRIYDTTIIEDINFALTGVLAAPAGRTEKPPPK